MMIRSLCVIVLAVTSAMAQSAPEHETALGAELRLERGRFSDSCGKLSIAGCMQTLFTDHPLHIAVGSIAPQNGFGAGLALVTHYDASKWYLKWDADAVASSNGSWRGGIYMKIIPVIPRGPKPIIVNNAQPGEVHKSKLSLVARPLFSLYAQGISLNKLGFFGLGPNTTTAGRSFFSMQQTIIGGNAIIPVPAARSLNLSLLGEMNGRFVDIRGAHGEPSPSIESLYTPVTAPGLATQPGFLQYGAGLRFAPKLEYLISNYRASFQQFAAPGDSTFSFRRFTLDVSQEIPFYGHSKAKASAPDPSRIEIAKVNLLDPDLQKNNNSNGCGTQASNVDCPTIQSTICDVKDAQTGKCTEVRSAVSRNREGSLTARLLISESIASGGSVVPFYFQQTLGGSDINGNSSLTSYQDYRFRAPNVLLVQETFDHSLYGPVGVTLMANQGKVALSRGDIDFQNLRHSFAAGLNIRAGGLPQIFLLFAWGGGEGTHMSSSVNTALLGGSARPSLY